jgi:hypothetical protein
MICLHLLKNVNNKNNDKYTSTYCIHEVDYILIVAYNRIYTQNIMFL